MKTIIKTLLLILLFIFSLARNSKKEKAEDSSLRTVPYTSHYTGSAQKYEKQLRICEINCKIEDDKQYQVVKQRKCKNLNECNEKPKKCLCSKRDRKIFTFVNLSAIKSQGNAIIKKNQATVNMAFNVTSFSDSEFDDNERKFKKTHQSDIKKPY